MKKRLLLYFILLISTFNKLYSQTTVINVEGPLTCADYEALGLECPPELRLPLDENLYFLIIAAILYGGYFFYKQHQKAKQLN